MEQHVHHECPGRRREKGAERIYKEIMAKNFPYLIIDMNINIQEAQQTPSMMNSKRRTPRQIIIKFSKDNNKDQILEVAKTKRIIIYKGPSTNYKIIYKFLIRNFGSQNSMDQYTEC